MYFVRRRIGRWNGAAQRRTTVDLLFGPVARDRAGRPTWDFAQLVTHVNSGDWNDARRGFDLQIRRGTPSVLEPPAFLQSSVHLAAHELGGLVGVANEGTCA